MGWGKLEAWCHAPVTRCSRAQQRRVRGSQVLALVLLLLGVLLAQTRGGQRSQLLSVGMELHSEMLIGVLATLMIAMLSGQFHCQDATRACTTCRR